MNEYLLILFCFGASIFASWLGPFLLSFFKKKGENLATKQDIQGLTKLTESVKKELDLIGDRNLSWQSLERDAYLNYYDALSIWHLYMTHLGLYEQTAQTESVKIMAELEAKHNFAIVRLRLFTGNTEREINTLLNQLHYSINVMKVNMVKNAMQYDQYVVYTIPTQSTVELMKRN